MKRSRFAGTRQILQFNWPFYAALVPLLSGASCVLRARRWPRWIELGGHAGIALGAWWSVAALVASWWIYDRSELESWRWVEPCLPQKPARWANFHAGLDESTLALLGLLGGEGRVFDFFDAPTMTEPSIKRARALCPPDIEPTPADFRALPLESDSLDAAFVILAAHEIRAFGERDKFFAELNRVLKSGGTLIVAEHTRDAWNFAAFGPGAFHFFAARQWQQLGARFGAKSTFRITPFIRVWVWTK
jgi:SAM-dependent methyltransferase